MYFAEECYSWQSADQNVFASTVCLGPKARVSVKEGSLRWDLCVVQDDQQEGGCGCHCKGGRGGTLPQSDGTEHAAKGRPECVGKLGGCLYVHTRI